VLLTRKQALLAALGVILLVAGSIGAQQLFALFVDFSAEDVQERVEDFGAMGPLVYIGLLIVSIVFSPLPTVALAVAAGLAYGTLLGTVYTLVGGIIGGVICFYLARRFGRPWVAKRISPSTMEYIDRLSLVLGGRVIFLMRLIPVFGFEWVSYAAGLTRMRISTFVIWSALGSVIPVLAINYVGENLQDDPKKSAIVFGGIVVIALASLVYLALRREPVLTAAVHKVEEDVRHDKHAPPA
jgi:uncharacterized membrane protein YdjX (TVP38/TMEM64 family)